MPFRPIGELLNRDSLEEHHELARLEGQDSYKQSACLYSERNPNVAGQFTTQTCCDGVPGLRRRPPRSSRRGTFRSPGSCTRYSSAEHWEFDVWGNSSGDWKLPDMRYWDWPVSSRPTSCFCECQPWHMLRLLPNSMAEMGGGVSLYLSRSRIDRSAPNRYPGCSTFF